MAPRIRISPEQLPKSPASIDRGYFYPGEVVRILGLEGLDYHQLRRLFRLVAAPVGSAAATSPKWSRFTFRDLVGLKTAIFLAGGTEALQLGRRLRLKEVERICEWLRKEFGVLNPLSEVAFRRDGRRIVAQIQGLSFEPISGQLVLSDTERAVGLYLEGRPDRTAGERGQVLERTLRRDIEKLRQARPCSSRAQTTLPLSK